MTRRAIIGASCACGTDVLSLCKLLTTHVRTDRITEGHLANVLESGHITAILRRLKQIRDAM